MSPPMTSATDSSNRLKSRPNMKSSSLDPRLLKSRPSMKSSSLDPRLCPRVMVDIDPLQGRALSTTHLDTVKVVHSYLRARSPNPMTVPDLKMIDPLRKLITGETNLHMRSISDHKLEPSDPDGCYLSDDLSHECFTPKGFEQELQVDNGYKTSSKSKQLTAYVAWVNSQLKKKPGAHLVDDLRHDVRDGVALVDLIEVIAGESLPDIHQAPSSHAEMRENVDKVLQFMYIRKIKMHHITTRDIAEGNLKAIMRLILALAAHYKPNSVRHSSQANRQNIAGIAQGAAAALTEARRNATRAGHRYRRRRQREDLTKHSDRRIVGEEQSNSRGKTHADVDDRAELEGASANSSPVSSQNASPRTSLYLSDPPSSMEGLLSVSGAMHRGGAMVTSCESDSAMGDSGYSEICDTLKETHEMLFQLHELLLTGESSGDAKTQSGSELERANPKETIIILKGRLLHAEEVAESLRADLTKTKKDCMELQGTKAGLQQRLKDQEGTLSGLKSEVMRLELEKEKMTLEVETLQKQLGGSEQVLTDIKISCVKQVEDKDRVIGDLRRELLKRDHIINQLQEQMSQMKEGMLESKQATDDTFSLATNGMKISTTEVYRGPGSFDQRISLLTECLSRLTSHEKVAGLKTSELETAKNSILQSRFQVPLEHLPNPSIDQLEEAVIKLLDKMHINGSSAGTVSSSRALNTNKERSLTVPSRRPINVAQSWRTPGTREVPPKVSPKTRIISSSSSSSTPGPSTRSSSSVHQGLTRGHQLSPRGSAGVHAINRISTGTNKGVRSQIPRPRDAQTNVTYYVDQSDKPLTCVINKQLGEIKLHDFKSVIEDSNLYHYFFKVLDPEYGTVKEELSCDDDILPGWEGKIEAWLEVEGCVE